MIIKFKKLSDNAVTPTYAKENDAAMDLTAVDIMETEDYIEYRTDISIQLPKDHVGLLFPRSSNSKKDLLLCNSVGVLDAGYRGSINFRFKKVKHGSHISGGTVFDFLNSKNNIYKVGEKIGQILIIPRPLIEFEEVDSLEESERGDGGFGSTDSK
jgi:dUTP pyrophosphatase